MTPPPKHAPAAAISPASEDGEKLRCFWAETNPLMRAYHDEEWGVPQHDSRALWEMLMLEGFQAGLSWQTILNKRESFREAFAHFDPAKVARFTPAKVEKLLTNPGIIRSRAKIEATIQGAKIYLEMESSNEPFAQWAWAQAGNKPLQNRGPVQTSTPTSEHLSKELRGKGFKFVGPVIVHAWMQATGMVNDHAPDCFRRTPVSRLA